MRSSLFVASSSFRCLERCCTSASSERIRFTYRRRSRRIRRRGEGGGGGGGGRRRRSKWRSKWWAF
jgi:hypothetical protein